ncbi:MAG TPA: hypothetical protein VEB43_14405 [Anaeromyxobacter sp.]|nr:hypothetical protein [Anaeromyxobacter sp.]
MSTSPLKAALALAIVISAAGCTSKTDAGAASGAMSFDWSQRSGDGKVELRLRRESRGTAATCQVQALTVAGGKTIWSSSTCLPVPSGLVFISRGGEKLVVLDLFPAAGVQSPNWSQVTLAQVWNRGKVEREYKGAEILAGDRAADMRTSYSWLRGESDEEVRDSARAVADGTQISLDLADGRTVTLGFDGAALPTPPSVAPRARPAEVAVTPEPAPAALPAREDPPPPAHQQGGLHEGELYRWQDESGAMHFGTGGQVPARYVKVARPVQGQVGVVPMEVPVPAPLQPGQPGQAAQQPGQPGRATPGVEPGARPEPPSPDAR